METVSHAAQQSEVSFFGISLNLGIIELLELYGISYSSLKTLHTSQKKDLGWYVNIPFNM